MSAPATPSEPESAVRLSEFFELLRNHVKLVVGLTGAGGVAAALAALLSARQFVSSATFVPEDAATTTQTLLRAAQQIGIAVPSDRHSWPPALYVTVLTSTSVLHPLAMKRYSVQGPDSTTEALADLLEVDDDTPARRAEKTVRVLRQRVVRISESRTTGSVTIEVTTRWPSLSHALASALLEAANTFNVSVRQTQAAAELAYAEERTAEALRDLRQSEEELLAFLNRNRLTNSAPTLVFQQQRLEGEVEQRRSLYYALVGRRDEARLRKLRDTPVVSIIDAPRVPAIGEARGTVFRGVLGAIAGFLAAVGFLLVRARVVTYRHQPATVR